MCININQVRVSVYGFLHVFINDVLFLVKRVCVSVILQVLKSPVMLFFPRS